MSNVRFEDLQQGPRFRVLSSSSNVAPLHRSPFLFFSSACLHPKAQPHLSPQWLPQTSAFSLASIVPRFRVADRAAVSILLIWTSEQNT